MIDKAVTSLADLCELGQFRKHRLFEISEKIAPLILHPNTWIRYGKKKKKKKKIPRNFFQVFLLVFLPWEQNYPNPIFFVFYYQH